MQYKGGLSESDFPSETEMQKFTKKLPKDDYPYDYHHVIRKLF